MILRRLAVAIVIALFGLLPSIANAGFFADVPETYPYASSIDLLRQRGIVEGFVLPGERRIFWPDQPVTRAEFVAMLVRALAPQTLIAGCLTDNSALEGYGLSMRFSDVPGDAWYAPSVCVAWSYGFISGYGDGTFHPDQGIPLAEAAKILATAFRLTPATVPDLTVLGKEWYEPFLTPLTTAGAVPSSVQGTWHILRRGEVAEMLARLLKLPSDTPPAETIALDDFEVKNPVDWKEFKDTGLGVALQYPNIWPEPWAVLRGTFDANHFPMARSLWDLHVGPARTCWGWNDCVETDFVLSAFPSEGARDAVQELEEAKNASVLSDKTVEGLRTVLFDQTDVVCTTRGAFLITKTRFLRFAQRCGSTLHHPETAFMRLLGRITML